MAISEITKLLKTMNEDMDKEAPELLPEVVKFLAHCRPIADMTTDYFMGSKFRVAFRNQQAQAFAQEMLRAGAHPDEIPEKAMQMVLEIEQLAAKTEIVK